jgi:hypothetical protein
MQPAMRLFKTFTSLQHSTCPCTAQPLRQQPVNCCSSLQCDTYAIAGGGHIYTIFTHVSHTVHAPQGVIDDQVVINGTEAVLVERVYERAGSISLSILPQLCQDAASSEQYHW